MHSSNRTEIDLCGRQRGLFFHERIALEVTEARCRQQAVVHRVYVAELNSPSESVVRIAGGIHDPSNFAAVVIEGTAGEKTEDCCGVGSDSVM